MVMEYNPSTRPRLLRGRKDSLGCSVQNKLQKHRIKSRCDNKSLLYGRGAPAIAREVEKAGVSCTVDQAQQFVADFMKQFPLVAKLIQDTHKQVEELHYVETLWGRREFFYQMEADKDRILAGQKRKAFNFLYN